MNLLDLLLASGHAPQPRHRARRGARSGGLLARPLDGRPLDSGGFYLRRPADGRRAPGIDDALARLPLEPELAIHPNCGTNMVVGGLIAGAVATLAAATLPPGRGRLALLPRMLLAGTMASVASQPLGPMAQRRWTTPSDVGGARVEGGLARACRTVHRVTIVDGPPRAD
ncbi:MAG: DUF6391 domain-containing protein [Anaerolineae bacterium]